MGFPGQLLYHLVLSLIIIIIIRGQPPTHLSEIAIADMQMLCNIFPILSSQLMKGLSFEQLLLLKKKKVFFNYIFRYTDMKSMERDHSNELSIPFQQWIDMKFVELTKWFHSYSLLSYSLLLCGLFYEAICCMSYHVSFCSCVFSVLLVLRLPRLGKRELILVLFVRLFDLCLFGFVGFLFLLVSGKGCGLLLWHSLDFFLTFFSEEKLLYNIMIYTCTQHRDRGKKNNNKKKKKKKKKKKNVEKFITVLGSYIIKRKHNTWKRNKKQSGQPYYYFLSRICFFFRIFYLRLFDLFLAS